MTDETKGADTTSSAKAAHTTSGAKIDAKTSARADWPLWEVFVRSSRGLSHVHAGSLHAPDSRLALQNARDVYTRRNEGVSIWVVPAAEIVASDPFEKDAYFEPASDKVYRHPTFYTRSEGVPHL